FGHARELGRAVFGLRVPAAAGTRAQPGAPVRRRYRQPLRAPDSPRHRRGRYGARRRPAYGDVEAQGSGLRVSINAPQAVAADGDVLYVAATGQNQIVRVDLAAE